MVGRHQERRRQRSSAASLEWQRLAPWPIAVIVGAIIWALSAWLICAAICMIGWLADISQPLSGPLGLATCFFLLANGSPVVMDGVPVSILPLLLTFGIMAIGFGLLRMALRHGFDAPPSPSGGQVAGIAGVVAGVYGAAAAVLAGLSQLGDTVETLIGGVIIGFITALIAAVRLTGWSLPWPQGTPAWVRALPRAFGAGLGILAAGGALVVCIALITSHDRVASLASGLDAGNFGSVLLAVGQAFWAPNLIAWGAAWLVGAGVALGTGTIVSPIAVQLGVLPSLPVFGAVPDVGAPPSAMMLWFAVPIAAGALAAWVAVRAQVTADKESSASARIDTVAAMGAGAGVITGLVATAVAALSRGDLGTTRLIGVGPILDVMVLLAPSLMGLGGVFAGLIVAVRRGKEAKSEALQYATVQQLRPPPQPLRPPTPPAAPGVPAQGGGTHRINKQQPPKGSSA